MAGVALMTLGWICWRAWAPLVARGTAALCVAGVSLGDIYRRVAWQAWRLATSTFVLRDRPGTWRQSSTFVLRGRRGTWRHLPSFCVAGVALGDIHHCFAWQAWRLATSTFVLRGRRALGDANTQTSTQTSFTHTSRTHNLEHTSLLNTLLSHTNLNTYTTSTHNAFIHNTHTHTTLSHKPEHTVLSHLFQRT